MKEISLLGDLYRMYVKYAESQGWKIEVLEAQDSEAGGYSLISFMIKGEGVYSKLKFESLGHTVYNVCLRQKHKDVCILLPQQCL